MDAKWDLNPEGNVTLAPVTRYTIAMFYNSLIAFRVEFARTDAQLRKEEFEVEQLLLSPQIALEIGEALVQRAKLALKAPTEEQAPSKPAKARKSPAKKPRKTAR